MQDISKDECRTVFFVSHDMTSIRQLCNKVILLSKGQISMVGTAEEVTSFYEKQSLEDSFAASPTVVRDPALDRYHFSKVEIRNSKGTPTIEFESGDSMEVHLWTNGQAPIDNFTIEYMLLNERGERISWGTANPMSLVYFKKSDTHFICKIGPMPLTSGQYSFSFNVRVWGLESLDFWEKAIKFRIVKCDPFKTGFDDMQIFGDVIILGQEWIAE